jgi:hypothetical protein
VPFAQSPLRFVGGESPELAGRLQARAARIHKQHRRLLAGAADHDRIVSGQLAGDREVAGGERVVQHAGERRLRYDGELRTRREWRSD